MTRTLDVVKRTVNVDARRTLKASVATNVRTVSMTSQIVDLAFVTEVA